MAKKVATNYDWMLVDTPPHNSDVIEQAIALADAVVIPVKAGLFDVMAAQPVIDMCLEHKKPFSLLLSAVDSKFKVAVPEARGTLIDLGPVFASQIEHRRYYVEALSDGKTGAEVNKDAKKEVDSLWTEVKRLAEGRRSK